MAWNGSGTYVLSPTYSPEVNGTVIDAVRYNGLTSDIATGINNALAKDGQNTATANIPMGGFKFTGLAAGSAAGNSVRMEQAWIQSTSTVTLAAATSNIETPLSGNILLNGASVTVTAFAAASAAGVLRLVRFNGVNTLTHNASTFSLPGSANITTASGDTAWFESTATGWACRGYHKASGLPTVVTSTLLSALGAAGADNTIANGAYAQTWQWAFTGNDQSGLKLTMSSSSTTSGVALLRLTGPNTLAKLFQIENFDSRAVFNIDGKGTINVGTSSAPLTGTGTGVGVNIQGQNATAATSGASGGDIVIQAGSSSNSGAANEGGVYIRAGGGGATNVGGVAIEDGYSGTYNRLTLSKNTGTIFSGTAPLVIDKKLFFDNTAGAPTISSGGGTGATIAGTDCAFEVTIGTGSPTSVVVNFGSAWTATPTFAMGACSQAGADIYVTALSTTQITLSSNGTALSSGVKVRAMVVGTQ